MQRILSRIYSTPRVHLSFSTSDEVGAQIAHGGGAVLSASPSQPSGDQTPVLPAAALDDAEAGVHRQTTFDEEGGLPELSADLGAEAERLRLTAPNMSLDVRQALRSLESSAIPFALLVLLVFVLHHLVSIAVFAWGTFVLHRSNQKLQAQVARRAEVQRLSAVALFAMLVVHAGVVSALGLSNTIYLIMSLSGAPLGTDVRATAIVKLSSS